MEFKKPNRSRRPLAPPLPRGDTARVAVRPLSHHPETVASQPVQKRRLSRTRRVLLNKKTIIALGIAGCLVAGMIVRNAMSGNSNAAAKKPDYHTVLPAGKTISDLGGWKRVSPPEKDPVFAFTDTLEGVAISVSEQPLPQAFKNDTDSQVADLAKKFNATDKVDGTDFPIYIGTSVKGPQSVIFANGKLLILIKSEGKITDPAWAKYAESLN